MKTIDIEVDTNKTLKADFFDDNDYVKLLEIYYDWISLSEKIKSINGRAINVPEILSEGLFCYFFKCGRTCYQGSPWDAFDLQTKKSIQIKASSVKYDLTSFGPTTDFDLLYFMDFAPEGRVNGIIDIYSVNINGLDQIVLNKKANITFADQQKMGRRPRLSIKRDLIEKYSIQIVKKINLKSKTSK